MTPSLWNKLANSRNLEIYGKKSCHDKQPLSFSKHPSPGETIKRISTLSETIEWKGYNNKPELIGPASLKVTQHEFRRIEEVTNVVTV